MIIALTRRQWRAIGEATGLGERLAMIGPMMDVDLDTEAGRYEARDAIAALLARWCAGHTLDEIRQAFAGTGVLWGQFQEFRRIGAPTTRAAPRRTRCSPAVDQPGIGRYLMPGLPLDFSADPRQPPRPAPLLGEHTDIVLTEVLGLSSAEIGRLHDERIVAGPNGR